MAAAFGTCVHCYVHRVLIQTSNAVTQFCRHLLTKNVLLAKSHKCQEDRIARVVWLIYESPQAASCDGAGPVVA